MLHVRRLKDNENYIVDLIQRSNGERFIRFRESSDPITEDRVLSTIPCKGSELRKLQQNDALSWNVPLTDGKLFTVDSHGIWMTEEEAKYWDRGHTQRAMENPDAPWVNKKPPNFPSK